MDLGKIEISTIGQGTGYDFGNLKIKSKALSNLIREGIRLGMNFVDTAESYGNGKAEKIIGGAVKGIRDKVIIGSKFSSEQSRYKEVIKACEGSLKRLAVDYIDLYQVHWPNPNVEIRETLSAMMWLKKKNKIRMIGVSNFSKKELLEAEKIVGEGNIFSVQTEYNLYERTIEQNGIFAFSKKHQIKIIAYSPLDQGRIDQTTPRQLKLLKRLAKKYEKTIAQLMLSWVISNKPVIAIPRTTNIKHLFENAQLVSFFINSNDMKEINKAFAMKIVNIPTNLIHVSEKGERQSRVYQTIDEALENKLGFVPSPLALSKVVKKGGFLKPVRLIRKGKKFELISGRVRYWAWVIAFGNRKPIPAFIRENLTVG